MKVALQVSQCSAWFQLQSELRNHIQTAAGLTFVPSEMKKRAHSSKPRVNLKITMIFLFNVESGVPRDDFKRKK